MKKTIALVLAVILVLSFGTAAFAANTTKTVSITYRGISIELNGKTVIPTDVTGKSVEPFIIDGTTYLPVRAVANALGLKVDWDNASSTVVLQSGGTADLGTGTVSATNVTKKAAITYRDIKIALDGVPLTPTDVNGKVVEPFIIDGTTYLPVRGIATALGVQVDWNNLTSTVVLSSETWVNTRVVHTETGMGDMVTDTSVFTYDANGNCISGTVTGSVNINWTATYNSRGNMLTRSESGRYGTTVYTSEDARTYDGNGNLLTQEHVRNATESGVLEVITDKRTCTYDANGNCVYESFTDTTATAGQTVTQLRDITRSFDLNGNELTCKDLTTSTDGGVNWVYNNSSTSTFDALGNCLTRAEVNLTTKDGAIYQRESTNTTNTYDAKGNCVKSVSGGTKEDSTGIVYSFESTTLYTYDALGNLLTSDRTETSLGVIVRRSSVVNVYNADGNVERTSTTVAEYENGVAVKTTGSVYTAAYDTQGRLVRESWLDGNETTATTTYTYGVNGHDYTVTTVSDGIVTDTYEYSLLK